MGYLVVRAIFNCHGLGPVSLFYRHEFGSVVRLQGWVVKVVAGRRAGPLAQFILNATFVERMHSTSTCPNSRPLVLWLLRDYTRHLPKVARFLLRGNLEQGLVRVFGCTANSWHVYPVVWFLVFRVVLFYVARDLSVYLFVFLLSGLGELAVYGCYGRSRRCSALGRLRRLYERSRRDWSAIWCSMGW